MEKSGKAKTVLLTQGEVNSFLNLTYAEKLPKGLRDVDVRLDRDRIQAKGLVNMERVKGKVGAGGGGFGPLSFLSGDVPVEIIGKLTAKDGFGAVAWESVYLSSMRVPTSVLEQLVLSATRSETNPEGVDISAPFRLPYSVNRLRLEPGRAFLGLLGVAMAKAVRFHKHGGPEVLQVRRRRGRRPGSGPGPHPPYRDRRELRRHLSALGPLPDAAADGRRQRGGGRGGGSRQRCDRARGRRPRRLHRPPGAYCEQRVVPADRLVKLPQDIGDEQAAAMMLKG